MKVRCIADGDWFEVNRKFFRFNLPNKKCDGPKNGDILTVVNSYYEKGIKYYELLEWPPSNGDNGFEADSFVPIEEQYEQVKYSEVVKEKAPCVN